MALNEMVDGKGGLRPHWRSLLGVLTGLGRATLVERAQRLERIDSLLGPEWTGPRLLLEVHIAMRLHLLATAQN